jgi:hypothetical protein
MSALQAAGIEQKRPSNARGRLLQFIFALAVVTYLDRVCISSAASSIRDDLHLTPIQMGWVFSAFTFAYAAFEVPSGWLGDVVGPRKVMTRIVLWWSAFTAATAFAWNFPSLIITRFLFGVGEAGAFPNASARFGFADCALSRNRRPADQRLLGCVHRRWWRARGHRHRLHEHLRQHWRGARAAGDGLCDSVVGQLADSFFHHGGHIWDGQHLLAVDRSAPAVNAGTSTR